MCRGTAVISMIYRSPGLTAITNLGYGNAKAFPDAVPIANFEYISDSSKYMLLLSSICNNNLEASAYVSFPTGMKVYSPGDIINVCVKFVVLLN
jgi:hypothetical protein